MAYENWYGLNYAIVYFYNVYGGREMADEIFDSCGKIFKID